jgi:hypothetical protein
MILAFKLLVTPFFIASVSLAGRRWGPGVSGLLMGLPLTSGPISLILALQYGPEFASQAAVGNLAGQASVCIFCLAYSIAALNTNWLGSTIFACLVFFLATFIWNSFSLALLPAFALLLIVIALVLRAIPIHNIALDSTHLPKWDLPARMVVATTFVIVLTTFADILGPQLSGLIAPFPVFGNVLAAFNQRQLGAYAAVKLLRGVVAGSVAFACFFLVVGGLISSLGILWTYSLATLAALGVNGLLFYRARA